MWGFFPIVSSGLGIRPVWAFGLFDFGTSWSLSVYANINLELGTWLSGELAPAGLTVVFDDPKGFLQPNNSMVLFLHFALLFSFEKLDHDKV